MASRVNVRFVVLLATVLVLVAGGTSFLAVKVVFKTAAQLASRGDAEMAAGEVVAAKLYYSKAVNKDPYNSEYLLKWRAALESWTPETDRELQTDFNNTYRQLNNQLALSDNMSHVEYQLGYIDLLMKWFGMQRFERALYEMVVTDSTRFIDYNQSIKPDDPSWLGLRRSRGLALAQIARAGLELTREQREQAEADFQISMAQDPSDYNVLEAWVDMVRIAADRSEQTDRRAEAAEQRARADALLADFLASNGEDTLPGIQAAMLVTQTGLRAEARAAVADLGPAATPRLAELADQYQQRTRALGDKLSAVDAAALDLHVIRRLFALETQTNTAQTYVATLPVLDRALAAHPDDPMLLLTRAEVLAARKEFDAAFNQLGEIIAKPRLPLSLAGWTLINAKVQSAFAQSKFALQANAFVETEEEKSEWLLRAKAARETLTQMLPETSPALQLLDAKLARARGDYFNTQRLLDQYNQVTNSTDREALWMAADVADKLGQPGNTKTALGRLLELDPTLSVAHVAFADVEYKLGRLESAREHYMEALKSNPEDAFIRERMAVIEVRLGLRESDDPVEGAIFTAQRHAGGTETEIADVAAAVESLRAAIDDLGPDPRLYAEMARLQMINGDAESAAEIVEQGLAAFPDDQNLLNYRRAVAGANSVDALIDIIRDSDQTEGEKYISIYVALSRAGRTEEANQALDTAAELEPDNPMLLELLFGRAFAANDLAEARRVFERAKAVNSDHMEGLSYRARILLMEGNDEEAMTALSQATQRAPNNTSLWRILGNVQFRLGRSADAIASYQQALSIRPNDMPTVTELCGALIALGRPGEALDIARRSEVYGRTNEEFMEMLLDLEGSVGDKQAARDRREKILAARPDDLRNRYALAHLYIAQGEWDLAKAMIAETREQFGDHPILVDLEARWHAEQNDMEAARRIFARDIANTPPEQRVNHYMALAQFMLSRGRSGSAFIAMKQAARYQPEGEFGVEMRLGATLLSYSRFADAYAILSKVIDAQTNPDRRIVLQAAEALIGIDRLSEAERLLGSVAEGETNITVALLRARILLKRGDGKAARAALDDAVTRWPTDHRVWILRAEAEALVPELAGDALADLNRAIELNPNLAEAHRRRAELLAELGREDEAITAWRDAVRLNPAQDDLRSALLATMIHRGMDTQAIQLAGEWFELHPRDVGLRARAAEMFVFGGSNDAAIDIYLGAFAIDQQPGIILRLVDLLLAADPPRLAEAERVLSDARVVVVNDASLLLARARMFSKTNRAAAAHNDCTASFQLVGHGAESMALWFSTMLRVFDDSAQALAYLRQLSTLPGAGDWPALFNARVLLGDDATSDEGLRQLRAVVKGTRDAAVMYSALRALSGNRYNAGEFEEALSLWTDALRLRPDDWQIENNIAFTLANHMNRPEEALPYAERATQHAPNNPEVHDTLGTVLLALGRSGEAITSFETAVVATRGTPKDAKYLVRLADAKLQSGDRQGAKDLLAEVEGLLNSGRELDDQYEAIRQKVRDGLGQG